MEYSIKNFRPNYKNRTLGVVLFAILTSVVTAPIASAGAPTDISTSSSIANGASNPSVVITGADFDSGVTIDSLTVTLGTTGLTSPVVTFNSATQITIAFTGTASAGDITIQASALAFDAGANITLPSNTLTVTVPPVTISTASTIANGAVNPSVVITGADFDSGATIDSFTVTVGTTGLTSPVVTVDSATQITIAFTGTASAGDITIQASTLAFSPVTGDASNTLTITVPAPAAAPAPAPVYIPTTPQAALTLTSSATTVEWGTQAKVSVTGGSGTGKITFTSRGSSFCAVDKDGNFTPVNTGICKITATKEGDGTYGSATSNTVEILAVDKPVAATTSGSASNSGVSMVVGKPVGGVATVKFTVADTYAGEKVSVILATKNNAGKTFYKTLGSAKVGSTGAVTFKTKVKLVAGAVLQLKSAGSVILSKSIQ